MTPSRNRLFRHLTLPLALCLAGSAALAADPAGGEALPRFDVLEFRIDGNSKLADVDIERAVIPFLGEGRTLLDIDAARAALEKTYHDAGWLTVSVSIPEQRIDGGEVALQVSEGEVGKLRVKGARYHANADIRDALPELAEGNVPNFPRMQEQLTALNRGSDLRVAPVLAAGKTPGTVDVRLEAEDELPLHGSVDLNNQQAPNGSATHLGVNLRYDNLWQRGHSISLSAIGTPEQTDESSQFSLTYVVPVGGQGDALALYAVRSRSKYDTISGSPGLGVLGNADIFGVSHALPLPALDDYTHTLNWGLDYKDILQSTRVGGADDQLTTPITYVPLVAAYSGGWLGDGGNTSFEASAAIGLKGLFGNSDVEFYAKREGASASFLAFKTSLQHVEKVGRWLIDGKVEVQLASGPLVSSEQYFAGGAESVRGYLEGELLGDAGLRLALQTTTPSLTLGAATSPWRLAGVAFYEGVRLHTYQAVYPQPASQMIRGAGVGLRLNGPAGGSLGVDVARAIDDADVTQSGDWRVHARLLVNF